MDFKKKGVGTQLATGVAFLAFFILAALFSIVTKILIFKKEAIPFMIVAYIFSEIISKKLNKNYDIYDNYNSEFTVILLTEGFLLLFLLNVMHNIFK